MHKPFSTLLMNDAAAEYLVYRPEGLDVFSL
jgi:hypothetical protein